jgi:hypothetical protein
MIPTPETYYGFVNSFGPRCMYDEGKRAAEDIVIPIFMSINYQSELLEFLTHTTQN